MQLLYASIINGACDETEAEETNYIQDIPTPLLHLESTYIRTSPCSKRNDFRTTKYQITKSIILMYIMRPMKNCATVHYRIQIN